MNDLQKQALYQMHLAGLPLSDIEGKQLRSLKTHWMDGMHAMPPIKFDIKVRAELRRREEQSATKPMRPFDKGFYK